jgi:hypothetical protein
LALAAATAFAALAGTASSKVVDYTGHFAGSKDSSIWIRAERKGGGRVPGLYSINWQGLPGICGPGAPFPLSGQIWKPEGQGWFSVGKRRSFSIQFSNLDSAGHAYADYVANGTISANGRVLRGHVDQRQDVSNTDEECTGGASFRVKFDKVVGRSIPSGPRRPGA